MGSPWTLATYIIEGGSTPLYKVIKNDDVYAAPDGAAASLLSAIWPSRSPLTSSYQIDSGAHCIQLFDSWGGQLPPAGASAYH